MNASGIRIDMEKENPYTARSAVYELICGENGYGVLLREADGSVLHAVREVSPSKARVAEFVERCNRLSLSAAHFYDALDDLIF